MYATNITPDAKTGIGGWTDTQIIEAIRSGRRPNGERLIPVHPYTDFNGMAEPDLKALVAYLRSLPAGQPRQPTQEDHGPPLRVGFPPRLAGRLLAARDAAGDRTDLGSRPR